MGEWVSCMQDLMSQLQFFNGTALATDAHVCVGGSKLVLNDGGGAECGSVGLSSGLHAVRAIAFQASPVGSFIATYRSCCHFAALFHPLKW